MEASPPTEPAGPSRGRGFADLEVDELHDELRHYLDMRVGLRRKGDGYGSWWCSKIISGVEIELKARGLAVPEWARNHE